MDNHITKLADQVIGALQIYMRRAVDLLDARLKALESRPAPESGAQGERGERGADGMAGRDGAQGERGADGIAGRDGAQGERGERGADGIAGRDGAQGERGERGADGIAGRDGAQGERGERGADVDQAAVERRVAELLPGIVARAVSERLEAVSAEWQAKAALLIPPGRDGLPGRPGERGGDGRDGFTVEDVDLELRDGRELMFTWRGGGQTNLKRVFLTGLPIYRGVYRSGEMYLEGDMVTYGGSVWMAKQETREPPKGAADDWKLVVKGGK